MQQNEHVPQVLLVSEDTDYPPCVKNVFWSNKQVRAVLAALSAMSAGAAAVIQHEATSGASDVKSVWDGRRHNPVQPPVIIPDVIRLRLVQHGQFTNRASTCDAVRSMSRFSS